MIDDFQPRQPRYRTGDGGLLNPDDKDEKQLPGFRGSSELPAQTDAEPLPYRTQPTASSTSPMLSEINDDDVSAIMGKEPEHVEIPVEPLKKPKKRGSKKTLVVLIVLLVLIGGGGAAWTFYFSKKVNTVSTAPSADSTDTVKKVEDTKPKLVASPLSGRDVEPALAERSVTGIMIENSTEARPQSGLLQADMVFEAIAEGGITRFLALFQESQPEYIGPVRSARPYYVDWARTFDAAYVHAGGSPDGLAKISELGVKDMSAFADSDVYYRTNTRTEPHNLYTSTSGVDGLKKTNGYTKSTFTPWTRKEDTPQTPTAAKVDFAISGPAYNVHYDYDLNSNSYLRSEGDELHTDEKSGQQLKPKTIVALLTKRGQDGIYSVYETTGQGNMLVFQDGIVSRGTWAKSSSSAQYVFKDQNGLDFAFNKGQTWVTLVEDETDITYAP